MRLLTPGPVPFQAEVPMKATSHTDPDFRKTMKRLQDALQQVFGVSGFTAALTGSGSWGGEVACMNFLDPTKKALVLSGGLFGARLAEMARLRGAQVHVVELTGEGKVPWGLLGDALHSVKPDLFFCVHVDTSTGTMVPVHEVLEFVRNASPYTLSVVDTVASAGNVPRGPRRLRLHRQPEGPFRPGGPRPHRPLRPGALPRQARLLVR